MKGEDVSTSYREVDSQGNKEGKVPMFTDDFNPLGDEKKSIVDISSNNRDFDSLDDQEIHNRNDNGPATMV